MQVIPLAIFLGRSDITELPYVYIISACVLLITSYIFDFIRKRTSISKLTFGTLVTLATSILPFWAILTYQQFYYAPLFLLVWGCVFYTFFSLVVDILFSSILTLQQAKRLYGPLDSAYSLGTICGAFSIPFLINLIGAVNLLLFAAFLILFLMLCHRKIKKKFSEKINETQKELTKNDIKSQASLNIFSLFKRTYILHILIIGILISFEYYMLDLIFNNEAQSHFQNEEKIATFLGIFNSIINITSLTFSSLLLRRILEKFGSIASLFAMPAATIIIISTALIFNYIPPAAALVFWLIALVRLIESIMNVCVNEQGIALLFQILRPKERLWAKTLHSSYAYALAFGLSGIILLLLVHFFGVNILVVGIGLIILCMTQFILLYLLRSKYVQELMTALAKRFIIHPQFQKIDKTGLSILRKSLHSEFPDEVTYALNVIEKADFREFRKAIIEALDHPSIVVREIALSKLEYYRISEAESNLLILCKKQVNEKIIITLAACGGKASDALLESWLSSSDINIRSGAILGLVKYGTKPLQSKAELALNDLTVSTDPIQRQKAAYIHGRIGKSPLVLLPFLQDENLEVRKSACEATALIQEKCFNALLIENLSIPALRNLAFNGLTAQNPTDLVDFLQNSFAQYPAPIQEALIKALEKMKGTEEFLLKILNSSRRRSFHAVLQALRQKHCSIDPDEVQIYLIKETIYVEELQAKLDLLGNNKKIAILHSLLMRELELGLNRIFMLLSFIYSRASIQSIEHGFFLHNEDSLNHAIELLLTTLTPEQSKHLVPILTNIQNRFLGLDFEPTQPMHGSNGLKKILTDGTDYYISNITSAALYVACMYFSGLNKNIRSAANLNNTDPIFQETALFALAKLN